MLLLFFQHILRGEARGGGVLLRGGEGNFREQLFQGTFQNIHNTQQLNIQNQAEMAIVLYREHLHLHYTGT